MVKHRRRITICNRITGAEVCNLIASNFLTARELFKNKFGFAQYYFLYTNANKQTIKVDKYISSIQTGAMEN